MQSPEDRCCFSFEHGADTYCAGAIGLLRDSDYLIDLSFDTLALLALFLVPRSVPYLKLRVQLYQMLITMSAGSFRWLRLIPILVVWQVKIRCGDQQTC